MAAPGTARNTLPAAAVFNRPAKFLPFLTRLQIFFFVARPFFFFSSALLTGVRTLFFFR